MKTPLSPRPVFGARAAAPHSFSALPLNQLARPFHVFIAYGDIPAAGRAMTAVNAELRSARCNLALHPMLWRFNQLTAANWREPALAQALNASVVAFASSSREPFSEELEQWVRDFLVRRRGAPTTFLALLGEEEGWTISIEEVAARPVASAAAPMLAEPQRLVA